MRQLLPPLRLLLPALLLGSFGAKAQLNYGTANATNVAGTYTDLGATGTVISTTSTDDANSTAQPIGFTFSFNGATFTSFVLNTNGYIKLGTAAPSAATLLNPIGSTDPLDVNIIAPSSNVDLQTSATATAEYRVFTSAAATGSRITTIQWKNVADKATAAAGAPAQFTSMQFQVKLYESNNQIEFVYGTWVAGTGTPTGQPFLIGLKGTTNGLADRLLAAKPSSATAWTATTFSAGTATTLPTHFVRNTFPPDAGRTYRFLPTVPNDAAVINIQTLGTVSSTYGSPVTVRAVVNNTGNTALTAVPVTLTVAGATTFTNTQTIPSLAAGASTTVTFTSYAVTTAGVNTLTVSLPTDGNTNNNTQTYSQTVTAASQGYIDTTQPFAANGVGIGAVNGVLAVKYTATTPATVTTITPTFLGAGTAGTTYQVQVYAANAGVPGTVLYTSPTLTRPAVTGPVATAIPSVAVSGDFFVGIKELNNNVALANQIEDPLRGGTFFYTTTGTTWIDVNTTTLKTRLALDVTLGAPASTTCAPVTALSAGTITNTTASISFTAPAGATGYIVTYTPTGGTATTVTPAPTASPVNLMGLTAGTTYTVSVTNNCGAGGNSAAVTTTFTTTGGSSTGPANDNCAGAVTLVSAATCTPTAGTVAGATQSMAPVLCAGFTATTAQDVWYQFVATATTQVVTVTGTFDGILEGFSGACGSLVSLGCGDASVGNNEDMTLTGLTVGTTYRVRYYPYDAVPPGSTFGICVTTPPPGPANDNCSGAIALTAGTSCTNTAGTNAGATASGTAVPAPSCGSTTGPLADVWYSVVVPASGALTVTTSAATGSMVDDTVLEIYSGTCASLTSVGCNDDNATSFFSTVALTGQTAGSTLYVRVRSFGTSATGAFNICVTTPPPIDAAVSAIYTLGAISQDFAAPHTVRAAITNTGSTAQTNIVVTLNVTGANTFTNTQTIATLAAGASTTVTFASYPLRTLGTNTVTVTIPADAVATNNTLSETQVVTVGDMSYTLPTATTFDGGLGSGAVNSQLYVKYTTNTPATLTAITPTFNGAGTAGDTYQLLVYNAAGTGGTPGAVLYTSPVRTRPTAGGVHSLTGISVPVSGSFFVATKQLAANNIGLAYLNEAPLRTGTFYFSANGTMFTDLSTSTFPARLAIGITLAPVPNAPVASVTVGAITSSSASVAFTLANGATSYTITYVSSTGTPVTVTSTSSPVALTGLANGTTYTVNVVANYPTGSSTPVSRTFTTLMGTATRAALGNGTLAVFPNPAHHSFTLTLPAVAGTQAAHVTLLNSLGQEVQARTIALGATGTQTTMEVANLAAGIYTLRVKAAEQVATIKVTIAN